MMSTIEVQLFLLWFVVLVLTSIPRDLKCCNVVVQLACLYIINAML